jgi:pyridoxal phosphate enzyme (YggS family)
MAVTKKRIEKNLSEIRENIATACARARRDPKDVSIVAVTKSADLEAIKNLLEAGLTELGESRVQQLIERAGELNAFLQRRRSASPMPVRWHLVGHLQRNKVKHVLECSTIIHSVDSLRLAEEINTKAQSLPQPVQIFLQVNCSQEAQKFGVAVGAAAHLAELIGTMPCLRLVGLMTMGPLTNNPEESRRAFARLRELFEEIQRDKMAGPEFRHLSMGMSGDYSAAVEEGATILRIGTALFA